MTNPLDALPPGLREFANAVFRELGVDVNRHFEAQHQSTTSDVTLPEGAKAWLHPENPILLDLRRTYDGHPAADHGLWMDEFVQKAIHLQNFRSENAYIWQQRELAVDIKYVLVTYYVRMHDVLGLLSKMKEDGAFGAYSLSVDGLTVSRDLLDSTVEIEFLCDTLKLNELAQPTVLDIGAGYGRLAHRLVESLPNLGHVLCTDAVPESTFVSQYYLRYRGIDEVASVVPLTDIEHAMSKQPVTVATNVHSFSECKLAAIEWWLDLLVAYEVRYLMIVPNSAYCDDRHLFSFDREDYYPALRRRGYRLRERWPKYYHSSSVQRFGLYPTFYYLFEHVG